MRLEHVNHIIGWHWWQSLGCDIARLALWWLWHWTMEPVRLLWHGHGLCGWGFGGLQWQWHWHVLSRLTWHWQCHWQFSNVCGNSRLTSRKD